MITVPVQFIILHILNCGSSCSYSMTPSDALNNHPVPNSPQTQHATIKQFLQDPVFNSYKNLSKNVKKYQCKVSQVYFLEKCINSEKVVPRTFKVRNKPYISNSNIDTWQNQIRKTEINLMNLAKCELKNSLAVLKSDINVLQENLICTQPELEQLKLRSILVDIQKKTLNSVLKEKDNKFKHLLQKLTPRDNVVINTSQNIISDNNEPNANVKTKKNRPGIKKRRHIKKSKALQKKKHINVIFNYSNLQLDEATIKLLNRGLNFSIKGPAPTISEIKTDCKMFNRRCLWKESNHLKEKEEYKPSIFKQEKTNIPPGPTPRALTGFLSTVESNLSNRSLWNKDLLNPNRRNISKEEYSALLNLQRLQNEKQIIVKPADKGSGTVILNYDDYIDSCNQHLNSKQLQPDGTNLPYYVRATEQELKVAKKRISSVLENAKTKKWITQQEYRAMDPSECGVGKFYQLSKVHKDFPEGSIPPGRPIISGNGSITEQISKYVDHHTRDIVKKLPTYIEDTRDFLNICEEINSEGGIPNDAIIVTIDVTALYTNICREDAVLAMSKALHSRPDTTIPPTQFLLDLLDLVFTCNFFEFDKNLYRQTIGTAMGTSSAVNSSSITMGMLIDPKLRKIATDIQPGIDPIRRMGRFLDDIISFWLGSHEQLELYLDKLNTIHPTIKFTYSYTCPFPCSIPRDTPHDCFCHTSRSIPFLDTLVEIIDEKIITDLYSKPTNTHQYLSDESCHPPHILDNIPYSLCYRIVRICSLRPTLIKRLDELKSFLLPRGYDKKLLDNTIKKSLDLTRAQTLQKVTREKVDRIPFVTTYHPSLPPVTRILKDAWKCMIDNDQHLKDVFHKPPMVAFRQSKNSSLRSKLIKTKLPTRNQRTLPGLKRCNKSRCSTCTHLIEGKQVRSSNNKKVVVSLPDSVTCETSNVVYCISCDKPACKFVEYIGETGARLKDRFSQHLGYIRCAEHDKFPTGQHFNLPGHTENNMKVSVIEKCRIESSNYRKTREAQFINLFDTKRNGLNKKL